MGKLLIPILCIALANSAGAGLIPGSFPSFGISPSHLNGGIVHDEFDCNFTGVVFSPCNELKLLGFTLFESIGS